MVAIVADQADRTDADRTCGYAGQAGRGQTDPAVAYPPPTCAGQQRTGVRLDDKSAGRSDRVAECGSDLVVAVHG
jgi:hypothetical protein